MSKPLIDAPAPWTLTGRAYVCMFRCSDALLDEQSFVPASLAGRRKPSPYGYMMFVDYASSPVGPYHELLWIPGAYAFEDGQRHLSISRIFVSTMDSVVNGQRNWGIPKDVAQFDVRYDDQGIDRVAVSKDGKAFARLSFRHWPIGMPVYPWMVPAGLRTLAQHLDDKTFVYTPAASGWVLAGKLVDSWFDPAQFPDLASCKPVLTTCMPGFRMLFPEARIVGRTP